MDIDEIDGKDTKFEKYSHSFYTSIFTSKVNSSILAEIPSELLFYMLEY